MFSVPPTRAQSPESRPTPGTAEQSLSALPPTGRPPPRGSALHPRVQRVVLKGQTATGPVQTGREIRRLLKLRDRERSGYQAASQKGAIYHVCSAWPHGMDRNMGSLETMSHGYYDAYKLLCMFI